MGFSNQDHPSMDSNNHLMPNSGGDGYDEFRRLELIMSKEDYDKVQAEYDLIKI
jgi:hypothetical protein